MKERTFDDFRSFVDAAKTTSDHRFMVGADWDGKSVCAAGDSRH
jgi:hypothetical protein